MPTVDELIGEVNTVDPVRAPFGSFRASQNVDVDNSKSAILRPGQTTFGSFGAIEAAYATRDMQEFYIIESSALQRVHPDGSSTVLQAGMPSGEYHWAEAGNMVFFNGPAKGMIVNGAYQAWGVDTAPPPAVSVRPGDLSPGRYLVCAVYERDGLQGGSGGSTVVDLEQSGALAISVPIPAGIDRALFFVTELDGHTHYFAGESADGHFLHNSPAPRSYPLEDAQRMAYPPPSGTHIAFFDGRMYVAKHIAPDSTVIYFSHPFFYHLFDQAQDYIVVPGEVRMLQAVGSALVIGTDRKVYAYGDGNLAELADYGMPDGQGGAWMEDSALLFVTKRGLCKALPFENLTQAHFSFDPGQRAVVQFVQHNGYSKAVVVTEGSDQSWNPYLSG